MNADDLTHAHDRSLANLARILAQHCRRLPADAREEIVDALVDCGFDDSDDPRGALETLSKTSTAARLDSSVDRALADFERSIDESNAAGERACE